MRKASRKTAAWEDECVASPSRSALLEDVSVDRHGGVAIPVPQRPAKGILSRLADWLTATLLGDAKTKVLGSREESPLRQLKEFAQQRDVDAHERRPMPRFRLLKVGRYNVAAFVKYRLNVKF
jgi:hypothetical protein